MGSRWRSNVIDLGIWPLSPFALGNQPKLAARFASDPNLLVARYDLTTVTQEVILLNAGGILGWVPQALIDHPLGTRFPFGRDVEPDR